MKSLCSVGLLVLMMFVVACGGGSKTPTAPAVSVSSVTLTTSTDMLKVGESMTFAANALHSNGANEAVTDWRSDMPSVATVDGSGRVTGVANGSATIIANHDGVVGTKLVKVVPDFGGTWSGYYTLTSCSATGQLNAAGACTIFAVGEVMPVRFTFSQNRESVTGTMVLGQVSGSVSGTIANGGLVLSGQLRSDEFIQTLLPNGTELRCDGGRLSGAFQYDLTSPYYSGYVRIGNTINGSLTKSAGPVMVPFGGAGAGARTLEGLAKVMRIQ